MILASPMALFERTKRLLRSDKLDRSNVLTVLFVDYQEVQLYSYLLRNLRNVRRSRTLLEKKITKLFAAWKWNKGAWATDPHN